MQLWDLKELIVNNNIPHFLIFSGEERTLLDTYVKQIEAKLGVKAITVSSLAEAYTATSAKSLLDAKVKVVLVKEDKSTLDNESLVRSLSSTSNYVIVILSSADKKASKKLYDKVTVVFEKLKPDILLSALQGYCKVKPDYLKWLIEACGRDYGRCLQELDKIKIFNQGQEDILFEEFARAGIIYCEIPDCIFDFSNAILKRDVKKSYSLYEDLKLRGDSSIQLFAVLYNNFRNLMIVQLSNNPTKESTGLEEKQINGIKWNKGKYTNLELMEAVLLISELDLMIKQGVVTELVAMEYFLAKVM